ncbi:MAG: hypothetical protein JWM98_131 [Thermoleophilia bacterium]|nr:hypothetical protein [Thermoleophilia bacterium]
MLISVSALALAAVMAPAAEARPGYISCTPWRLAGRVNANTNRYSQVCYYRYNGQLIGNTFYTYG